MKHYTRAAWLIEKSAFKELPEERVAIIYPPIYSDLQNLKDIASYLLIHSLFSPWEFPHFQSGRRTEL